MTRLSQMDGLDALSSRLPSPLAVPLAQLSLHIEGRDWFKAFLAGMDVFQVGLRWFTFVGISDIMQKLENDERFTKRARLEHVYPAIHEVLLPGRTHGLWVACARALLKTYERDPDAFILPAFIRAHTESGDASSPFAKNLEELIATRNRYAHRDAALPPPAIARQRWDEIDPVLGAMVHQLATFADTELVRFDTPLEPDERSPGWYHSKGHLTLRGFNMHEKALRTRRHVRFYTGTHPPPLSRLYLFNRDRTHGVMLHPFLLFDLSGDLLTDDQLRGGAATFLFNELQDRGVLYTTNTGTAELEIKAEDERTEHLAGPIMRRFEQLKYVTGASDTERLHALPGFPRRSKVVDFSQLIAFHTDAFVGRADDLQRIEHAIAGPFRAVWVRGKPGFGKTALLARLAQMLPHAIPYFISAEKGTSNATTFFQHMSQAIIDRFRFPDVLPDEASDVEAARATWSDLTARATELLQRESKKLVFIIDGLDESLRYAAAEDERIQQHLPATRDEVPDGAFFVIASRPTEVELSPLVDFTIDLEPFSAEQVSTILGLHGWSSEAAQLAFERSDGNPLYFRFLIEGIKAGTFTAQRAAHLPKGIEQLYRSYWLRWERDALQRKDAPAAERANASLHMLGFLSAAREPLSLADLHDLLLRIDLRITADSLRMALRKEHLGRFIIGSTRFALLHDTLRAFVAEATRAPDTTGPYGSAQRYHEILAEWCVNAKESAYPADYQVHHLLHARRFEAVIARLAEKRDRARPRTLTPHEHVRLRDLDAGIAAARELGELPHVFRFSAERLTLHSEHRVVSDPATAAVLARVGDVDALEALYGACDTTWARWQVASSAVAAAISGAPNLDAMIWQARLTELATEAHTSGQWGVSWLEVLLLDLHESDAEAIARVLDALPGETVPEDACEAIEAVLLDRPLVAWRLIARLPDPKYASEGYVDSLHRLAFVLLHRNHEEAWEALALGQRMINELGYTENPLPPHVLRPFLGTDPARTLATVAMAPVSLENVAYLIALGHLVLGTLGAVPEPWCDAQPARVRALLLALAAAADPNPQSIDHAAKTLLRELEEIPLPDALACLTNLDRATTGFAGTGAESPWRDVLIDVLGRLNGAAEAARLFWGECERDVYRALSSRLPAVGPFINEFGDLFDDRLSAILAALSATPSSIAALARPELQAWLHARGATRQTFHGDALLTAEVLHSRLAQYVREANDRADVQSLVLPYLLAFAADPRFRAELDHMGPVEIRAAYSLDTVGVLQPSVDLGESSRALEHLTYSHVRPPVLTNLVEGILIGRSYVDPRWALESWRELDASGEIDHGLSGADAVGLSKERVAEACYTAGLHHDAYELARSGSNGKGYWRLFLATDHGPFDAFLHDVQAGIVPDGLAASDQELTRLVERALSALPPEQRRDHLATWSDAAAAGHSIDHAQLLALLQHLDEIDASRLEGVAAAGQRPLSTPTTLADLMPWIIEVATSHADRGIRLMHSALKSIAASSSADVSALVAELDTTIVGGLTTTSDLDACLESPSWATAAWFPKSRRAILRQLVHAGRASDSVEPYLDLATLDDVCNLVSAVFPAGIPSWLGERLHAAALSAVGHAEDHDELLHAGALLLAQQAPEGVFAHELAAAVGRRLRQLGADPSLGAEFARLAEAILERDHRSGSSEPFPSMEEAIAVSVASVDPELAWDLLEGCGEPARARHATRVFERAARTRPAWAVTAIGSLLDRDNAGSLLASALNASHSDTWHLFRDLARHALRLANPEELSPGDWRRLLERDVELAAEAASTSRADPLVWLGVDRESHPRVAEMLELDPLMATATLTEAWRSHGANTFDLERMVGLLGAMTEAGHEAAAKVLRDTLAATLRDPAVALEDDLGSVLQELAASEPELAAELVLDLGYAGSDLDDIAHAIARAGPAHVPHIVGSV